MPARIRVLPYRAGSNSARQLAEAIGGLRLRLEGSTFRPRRGDLVVNWGSSSENYGGWVNTLEDRLLNHPSLVDVASNKLNCFRELEFRGVSVPPFTTNLEEAQEWSLNMYKVCVRATLRGSGGEGLTVVDREKPLDIPQAPLYTKYVPKASEWRIHVFRGTVFDIQRKIRDPDDNRPADEVDFNIRNHGNGFVFIRGFDPAALNDQVKEEAVAAVGALRLDFGAVDVIWNQHNRKAYVLEVNTAPGLEGASVENYATQIRRVI